MQTDGTQACRCQRLKDPGGSTPLSPPCMIALVAQSLFSQRKGFLVASVSAAFVKVAAVWEGTGGRVRGEATLPSHFFIASCRQGPSTSWVSICLSIHIYIYIKLCLPSGHLSSPICPSVQIAFVVSCHENLICFTKLSLNMCQNRLKPLLL